MLTYLRLCKQQGSPGQSWQFKAWYLKQMYGVRADNIFFHGDTI